MTDKVLPMTVKCPSMIFKMGKSIYKTSNMCLTFHEYHIYRKDFAEAFLDDNVNPYENVHNESNVASTGFSVCKVIKKSLPRIEASLP